MKHIFSVKFFQGVFFYAVLFLLPLQTRYFLVTGSLNGGFWEYGTLSIWGIDMLIGLCLLLWILRDGRSAVFSWMRRKEWMNQKEILFFLSFVFLNIFFAQSWQVAWYMWSVFLIGYILFVLVRGTLFTVRKSAWVLLASGVVQSVLALWQFVTQFVSSSKWLGMSSHFAWQLGDFVVDTGSGRFLRAYGMFAHPNILGVFLLMCFWFSVYLLQNTHTVWNRCVFWFSQGFVVLGMFLSFSRSSWITFVVSCCVYVVFFERSENIFSREFLSRLRKNLRYVFVGLIIFFVLCGVFSEIVSVRLGLGQTHRLETLSLSERSAGYQDFVDEFPKHWLWGVGVGNTTLVLSQVHLNLPSYKYQPFHSVYLSFLFELGVMGCIVLLHGIFQFWSFTKTLRAVPLAMPFLCFLFIGLFDHFFLTLHSGVLLLAVAFAFMMHYHEEKFQ